MNEVLRLLDETFPGETLPQLMRSNAHPTQTLDADLRYVKHVLLVMNSMLLNGSVSKRYCGAAPGIMTAAGSAQDMAATLADAPLFYSTVNAETLAPEEEAVTHEVVDRIRDLTRGHVRYLKAALWCSEMSKVFIKIAHGMRSSAAQPSLPYITSRSYETQITADFLTKIADTDLLVGLLTRKTLLPVLPYLTNEELNLVAGLLEFTSKGREWVGPTLRLMQTLKNTSPYLKVLRECLREDEFRYWPRSMTGIVGKLKFRKGKGDYTRNMSRLATRAVFIECALTAQPDEPATETNSSQPDQRLILNSVNTFDNLNHTELTSASITTVGAFVGSFLNTTLADSYELSEETLRKTDAAITASKPYGTPPQYMLTILNGSPKIPFHVTQAVHGVMMGQSASLGIITAVGVRQYPSLAFIADGALRLRYAKHVLTTRTVLDRGGNVVDGVVSDELIERLWSAKLVVVGYGGLTYGEMLNMMVMYARDGYSTDIAPLSERKAEIALRQKTAARLISVEYMITEKMEKTREITKLIKSIDELIAEPRGETVAEATTRAAVLARRTQNAYVATVAAMADGEISISKGNQRSDRILTSFNPLAQILILKNNMLRTADGTLVLAVKVQNSDMLRLLVIKALMEANVSLIESGLSEETVPKLCGAHIAGMRACSSVEQQAETLVRIIIEDKNKQT